MVIKSNIHIGGDSITATIYVGNMNPHGDNKIDEAYKNYYNKTKDLTSNDFEVKGKGVIVITGFDMRSIDFYGNVRGSITNEYFRPFTKVEFINKIKTDKEFSERWGLKIEERELSLEERSVIAGSNHNEVSQNIKMFNGIDEDDTLHKDLDSINVPTKLISVTYNNETIEIYE